MTDFPWNQDAYRVLDQPIESVDVLDDDESMAGLGGLQGLSMRHMDNLMVFWENNKTMAFIGLRKFCPRLLTA